MYIASLVYIYISFNYAFNFQNYVMPNVSTIREQLIMTNAEVVVA